MKVGIMQPYFFPYLGYISLIRHTDRFILLDDVQFMRHGWIERNRILKPGGGWQYISVPLKKRSLNTAIKDTEINSATDWRSRIIRQLEHYRKRAPYYRETLNVVEQALSTATESIVELNAQALSSVCRYLNIERPVAIYSETGIIIEPPAAADEWALNICKSLGGVTQYRNPVGGQSFFNPAKYEKENIQLVFHDITLTPYQQLNPRADFEAGLSIIDVMMFNTPDEITLMLDNYGDL